MILAALVIILLAVLIGPLLFKPIEQNLDVFFLVVGMLAAIPITILANAARVVATGLIGQWFGVEYASGFFHEFAGLVVYVFAFVCLMGVYGLIQACRAARRNRPA